MSLKGIVDLDSHGSAPYGVTKKRPVGVSFFMFSGGNQRYGGRNYFTSGSR